ncbi:MAG: hypothetical protein DCO96_04500 [Fluviicola sp. XM-24bin1]|nr:MAG: hypothetical protein DCO96_04500 [Fluviicola sp. XM-24bin1]
MVKYTISITFIELKNEIMKKLLLMMVGVLAGAASFAQSYNVTFQVDMNQYGGTFTTPEVNGTFNGWCGNCNAMSDANADGIWDVTVNIPAGTHEFKFAHDAWTGQENFAGGEPCTVTNGGFTNRSLNVVADTVLDVVCWESCAACGTPPMNYNVTFQVDMNQYGGTFTTPEVNGTFNGWCGNCNAMSDANADGIWDITVNLPAGSIEYKYAHDSWTGQENLTPGSSCTVTNGGFTNRFLDIQADTILPAVCWEECVACGTTVDTNYVTFQVDMTQYGGTFTTPEINGDFNGWCGGCNPMSDANADGIWDVTLPFTQDSIEFKYAYDAWTGQENLTPGSSCTKTTSGFTNRFLIITADTTLPVVCWDSCVACSTTPPPPVDTNYVTFQVDMNQYGGTFTTPEVNGTFNGWCGNCNPMTDANADGIWEATLPITADTIEFKYAYDNWTGQENLTPGLSCTATNGGFTNRFAVITSDTTFAVVCWDSCVACVDTTMNVGELDVFGNVSIYPNPAQDQITIAADANGLTNVSIEIIGALGQTVLSTSSAAAKLNEAIDVSSLENGFYVVVIRSEEGIHESKFMIAR